MLSPTTSCLLSDDTAKQVALKRGMTTDWVLVMVSSSYKASFDEFSNAPILRIARKDPEGENTASKVGPAAFPMISLAKSEEPSAFQSRMIDPLFATAMQAVSAPSKK
jgi:hypothetical protein